MSKRESSVGLVLVLVATFGLSAGGIWWAHQFGFGTHSSVDNQLQTVVNFSQSTTLSGENTQSLLPVSNSKSVHIAENLKPIAAPSETATPKHSKTADNLENFPVKGQVKFVIDSTQITNEGQQVLERLTQEIQNFDANSVVIKIRVHGGESESSKTLAQRRGDDIAGYFRDKGLAEKIIISNRSNGENAKQAQNPAIEIILIKN